MVIVAGSGRDRRVLSIYLQGPLRAVERDSGRRSAHGDPFVRRWAPRSRCDHIRRRHRSEGVAEAIPTGLGPTVGSVPPEVVEAAAAAAERPAPRVGRIRRPSRTRTRIATTIAIPPGRLTVPCHGSRSSSPAARSACATTPRPAATCRPSPAPICCATVPELGEIADVIGDRSRADTRQPLPVPGAVRDPAVRGRRSRPRRRRRRRRGAGNRRDRGDGVLLRSPPRRTEAASSSQARCDPASQPDYDGPRNLADAVRVAASLDAATADLGAVVVLDGSIEPADDVTKTHASAFDTFRSLDVGYARTGGGRGGCGWTERADRAVTCATSRAAERVYLVTATVATDGTPIRRPARSGRRRLRRGRDRRGQYRSSAARRGGGRDGRRAGGGPRHPLPGRRRRNRLRVPRRWRHLAAGRRAGRRSPDWPKARIALALGPRRRPGSRRSRGAARRSGPDPRPGSVLAGARRRDRSPDRAADRRTA